MQEGFDVDWLVENGFVTDLLKALTGDGEFCDEDAFKKLDIHSRQLRRMTILHLEYLIADGHAGAVADEDKNIISPYPEYFEAWKLAGCPGLSLYQLDRLVKSKR